MLKANYLKKNICFKNKYMYMYMTQYMYMSVYMYMNR